MKLDALVMAGGRGSRLGVEKEKPLLIFNRKYLIYHVLETLKNSRYIDKIFVVTSRNTKKTEQEIKKRGIPIIRAPGKGYVEDMLFALQKTKFGRTLVISADLPLLHSKDIDWVIEEYFKQEKSSLAVMVPKEIFEKHNLKPTLVIEGYVPAGINIVDGKNLSGSESKLVSEKLQFALNINTPEDLKTAKSISNKLP